MPPCFRRYLSDGPDPDARRDLEQPRRSTSPGTETMHGEIDALLADRANPIQEDVRVIAELRS